MKIKSAIFASSNKNKLKEIEEILGIKVKGTSLEIEEIQSLDSGTFGCGHREYCHRPGDGTARLLPRAYRHAIRLAQLWLSIGRRAARFVTTTEGRKY